MDLRLLRDKIDNIDQQIITLFEERIGVAEDVARYKIEQGKPVYDPVREKAKILHSREMVNSAFNANGIEALMNQIMAISRVRQYELIAASENTDFHFQGMTEGLNLNAPVVYQGVEGAYGHQATIGFFGEQADMYHVSTFEDVMKEVDAGNAVYGVLPIENSSTGIITDVYDLLNQYNNTIIANYVVKVEHALIGLDGTSLERIHTVYSHAQGLMQCSRFLEMHDDWNQVSLQNTAVSARKVYQDQDASQAAIASPAAAKEYKLHVLKEKISDNDNNSTRFIIIQKNKAFAADANEVSITFELAHETGSLYHVLGFIIYNNLNMSKIESRPIQGEKWRYRFFINFDGNLGEAHVRDALKGIENETINFKILGNYVKAE